MSRVMLIIAGAVALLLAPGGMADEPKLGVPTLTLANLRVVMHGAWGPGPGEFGKIDEEHIYGPALYMIDNVGNFIIVDCFRNNRLHVFDEEGRFTRSVPIEGAATMIALAADTASHVYLTSGREIIQVSLDTGKVQQIGPPPAVFGGIHDLVVASLPTPSHDQQARRVKLFLEQPFATLDGAEMWVHGYDCGLELVRFGGMRGYSPVIRGPCTLYTIASFANTSEGSHVTIKYWNYQELLVKRIALSVPVKITSANPCKLLGVSSYPPCLYLFTYDPVTEAPGHVWKFDRSGELIGAVIIGDHLPRAPIAWMNHSDRFVVDAAGDLYVNWADPEKGYYISKLRTAKLGEIPR